MFKKKTYTVICTLHITFADTFALQTHANPSHKVKHNLIQSDSPRMLFRC